MQEKHDMVEDFKHKFNFAYLLCLIHQRCLVLICRKKWGVQALGGLPTFLALILMIGWASFSRDLFFWAWIALWLCCLVARRIEALKLVKTGLHSLYDGWSDLTDFFRCSEKAAKLIVEPVMFGILGGILLWAYTVNELPVMGLPYFFLSGVFTLPFVEAVKQTIWNKRLQAMNDARVEQQAAVQDFREKYGDSNGR